MQVRIGRVGPWSNLLHITLEGEEPYWGTIFADRVSREGKALEVFLEEELIAILHPEGTEDLVGALEEEREVSAWDV
jgi:hypothetical protein